MGYYFERMAKFELIINKYSMQYASDSKNRAHFENQCKIQTNLYSQDSKLFAYCYNFGAFVDFISYRCQIF